MTLEEFSQITRRVIARDGFAEYLPTAVYPERREVVVLEGAPERGDLEDISFRWAADRSRHGEEFLVAFKSGPNRFKVVRHHAGLREDAEFDATEGDV